MGIAYPFVLADFHTSYAVLGLVLGVTGVVGGLLQGLAAVIKHVSARVLLAGQNLAMGVVTALAAVSPVFPVFAVARFMGALVSWPQHPVGSAYLTERFPDRRGSVLAWHTTGGNVGTVVVPLIASAIIALWGWRWALAVFAVLMALGSLVTSLRLRRAPAQEPAEPRQPGSAQPSASFRKAVFRRPALLVLAAGMVSGAGRGLGVLTTYIPAYLRAGLHLQPITVGALVTVMTTGAVAGPVIAGIMSDRLGRRQVLYVIYGAGALALLAFPTVGASLAALAGLALAVGIFSYSEQPLRQALFSDYTQGASARAAFGAYFAISQSIGALWITALGAIITTIGFQAAFVTMAASFVVAGTIIAVSALDRPGRGRRPAQQTAESEEVS